MNTTSFVIAAVLLLALAGLNVLAYYRSARDILASHWAYRWVPGGPIVAWARTERAIAEMAGEFNFARKSVRGMLMPPGPQGVDEAREALTERGNRVAKVRADVLARIAAEHGAQSTWPTPPALMHLIEAAVQAEFPEALAVNVQVVLPTFAVARIAVGKFVEGQGVLMTQTQFPVDVSAGRKA